MAIASLLQRVAAHPVEMVHHHYGNRQVASTDPEANLMAQSGEPRAGEEQKNDMANNSTEYSSSDAEALTSSASGGTQKTTVSVLFLEDFVFNAVDYPIAEGAQIHQVDEQVDKYPDYKVATTGRHSLGGAPVLLCALDLLNTNACRNGVDNMVLYTQGQPRVGDPAFVDYVLSTNFSYERIVSKRDIVPHLPPSVFNLLHAGEDFWAKEDETVREGLPQQRHQD
ncbi:class 3-domain-containing protein [Zychaea mexicana]|uniref:class 3-domain-containing protein n=1 Tax=Zychaea mexicana TaxID=64656 RepID=UPI0022FDC3C9|nr:class 3-domain-containing protein [Zychaea mexicana]KAI9489135.1 class 3-domain-containing protein [Zychaea mexicana]